MITSHLYLHLASHWLPVHYRTQFKNLLLVFKSLKGMTPPNISELVQPCTPFKPQRSTNHLLLDVLGSVSVVAPNFSSSLPFHIGAAQTLDDFKTLLRTHFFSL